MLCTSGILKADVIHIYEDGSGDYPTIQAGIDGAEEGDTVLVYPGRYVENVDFNGKNNLTLASLEMITENADYIDLTIIDGNNIESCIRLLEEEQNEVVRGFTITNGYGSIFGIGTYSSGGGILMLPDAGISVINCKIYNNFAVLGGGILGAAGSDITLSGVTIKNNNGAGIFTDTESNIVFDGENRCNIYNNYPYDIHASDCGQVNVVLDTFTVINPDQEYFAIHIDQFSPHGGYDFFTFDILNGWMELVNQDLYVAEDGDDNNSGLTPDDPLKNVAFALHKIVSDPTDPKTVHVAAGEYHWDDGQIFPLYLKSYVNLIGDDVSNTFLTNHSITNMILSDFNESSMISNFTINGGGNTCENMLRGWRTNNVVFRNMVFEDCMGNAVEASYFYETDNMLFDNVTFQNITAQLAAGIFCPRGNGRFTNCKFDNLRTTGYIGIVAYTAFYFICSDTLWIENTIFTNSVQQYSYPDNTFLSGIFGAGNQQYHNSPKYMVGCLINNNESIQDIIFGVGGIWENIYFINSTYCPAPTNWTSIRVSIVS